MSAFAYADGSENRECNNTTVQKTNFLFIYHGACPLVQAFRPIPTKPTPPDPAAMQIRGGERMAPLPFPPTQKHDHKRKREQRKGEEGGRKKKLSYSIFETATRVCGWAGGEERRKLFTTPWSLPLSFPACKSLFLLFLDHVSDRERGRKRREEEGGGFGS